MGRLRYDNNKLHLDDTKHKKKHRKENVSGVEDEYSSKSSKEYSTEMYTRHHFTRDAVCEKEKKTKRKRTREDAEESGVEIVEPVRKKHKKMRAEEDSEDRTDPEEATEAHPERIFTGHLSPEKKKKKKGQKDTREDYSSQHSSIASPNINCEDDDDSATELVGCKTNKKKREHFSKEDASENSEAAATRAHDLSPSVEHTSDHHKMRSKRKHKDNTAASQDTEESELLSESLESPATSPEGGCSSRKKKRKKNRDVMPSPPASEEDSASPVAISSRGKESDSFISASVSKDGRRKKTRNMRHDSSRDVADLTTQPFYTEQSGSAGPASTVKKKHKANEHEDETGAQGKRLQEETLSEKAGLQEGTRRNSSRDQLEEQETDSSTETPIWNVLSKPSSNKENQNTECSEGEGSPGKLKGTQEKHGALTRSRAQSNVPLDLPDADESDVPLFFEDDISEKDVSFVPAAPTPDETSDDSDDEHQSNHTKQDGLFHGSRPSSPVDEDFMVYASSGKFPEIHKTSCNPTTRTITGYEKETGLTLRMGRFTKDEDAILRRNYRNITKYFKLRYPFLILGIRGSHTQQELSAMRKFARNQKLLPLLGKDLPRRTLRMLYRRARTLFDPSSTETSISISKEESQQILALHERLGPLWHEIGRRMGLPAEAVRSHFRWAESKGPGGGRWTADEEMRLREAMRKVGHKKQHGQLHGSVTWEEISKLVGTRGPVQCYKRWVESHHLSPGKDANKRLWGVYDTIHLISRVNSMEVLPQNDYDWIQLSKEFPVVKRGSYLRKRWRYIVNHHVPKEEQTSPKACASYLSKYYLRQLLSSNNVSIEDAVKASKECWLMKAKTRDLRTSESS